MFQVLTDVEISTGDPRNSREIHSGRTANDEYGSAQKNGFLKLELMLNNLKIANKPGDVLKFQILVFFDHE